MNNIPHDADLERMMLGAFLLAPEMFMPSLTDCFYIGKHRLMYDAMEKLSVDGVGIEPYTVGKQLQEDDDLNRAGGVQEIADLFTSAHEGQTNIDNFNHHLGELDTLRRKRLVYFAAFKITHDAQDDELNLDVVRGILDAAVPQYQKHNTDYLEEAEAHLLDDSKTLIATGFPQLDQLIAIRPSNLVIIAGRPSIGKSSFAQNVAMWCANWRRRVYWITREMSCAEVAQRMMIQLSGCSAHELKEEEGKRKYAMAFLREQGPFLSQREVTVAQIQAKAKMLEADVVVVDYLQLLSSSREYDNLVQSVTDISRNLKLMATTLEVPVIALSQLSRANTRRADSRPVLSDLRESGAIEQDADIVLMLYQSDDDMNSGNGNNVGLRIAKNRNGMLGEIDLRFRPELFLFEEL